MRCVVRRWQANSRGSSKTRLRAACQCHGSHATRCHRRAHGLHLTPSPPLQLPPQPVAGTMYGRGHVQGSVSPLPAHPRRGQPLDTLADTPASAATTRQRLEFHDATPGGYGATPAARGGAHAASEPRPRPRSAARAPADPSRRHTIHGDRGGGTTNGTRLSRNRRGRPRSATSRPRRRSRSGGRSGSPSRGARGDDGSSRRASTAAWGDYGEEFIARMALVKSAKQQGTPTTAAQGSPSRPPSAAAKVSVVPLLTMPTHGEGAGPEVVGGTNAATPALFSPRGAAPLADSRHGGGGGRSPTFATTWQRHAAPAPGTGLGECVCLWLCVYLCVSLCM